MAEDVALESEDHRSHTVLRVNGYLDVSTSPRLRERLLQIIDSAARVVLLDIAGVEFLDSSALGVILNAWKQMQADEGILAVVAAQPRIAKIFEITALNLSISMYPSLAEARSDLGLSD